MMINLSSDNWTGCHPSISDTLSRHSAAVGAAYGASDLDKKIERTFKEIFESDVAVYFVGTGTAANALSMAYLNRAGGIIFAHRHAHLIEDECGAPEYFTGGARLVGVGGAEGRIDPEALESAIRRYDPADPDSVHAGRPMAVSVTQSTESGTLYSLAQIRRIANIAHAHGIPLHMDGARFTNAVSGIKMAINSMIRPE
uniref:Beta_elim_lyase domain-containing protein n=1 Tax=Globodera pallida TaxID=36090 RepID=A0A183CPU8_GLOPA